MKLLIELSEYFDMTPCCQTSVFDKGAVIPHSAIDACSLNDFGYLNCFPLQWKFVGGHEGPVSVCSYKELWVGTKERFLPLPTNGEERFHDGVSHFPATPDLTYFVATTIERMPNNWIGHLLIYNMQRNNEIAHRITLTEYISPIQFIDSTRLLTLKADGIYVLSVVEGTLDPLFQSHDCVYTNAHLSLDGKCACAVRARSYKSKPIGVTICHIESGQAVTLKFGRNTKVEDGLDWLADCIIPLRVDNGMRKLVIRQTA